MDVLKRFISNNRLSVYTVISVFSGLVLGLVVRALVWPDGNIDSQLLRFISLPGVIYIRLFLLLIIPLLVTSLATSFFPRQSDQTENSSLPVSNKDIPEDDTSISSSRLFLATFIVFIAFSLFAAFLGCFLAQLVQPGTMGSTLLKAEGKSDENKGPFTKDATEERINAIEYRVNQSDTIYNIVLNIFPDNPLKPFFMMSYTKSKLEWPSNKSLLMEPNYHPKVTISTHQNFKGNMLGICLLSLCLGLILHQLGPEKTKVYRRFLEESDDIVRFVMRTLMRIMPFGIFCWMFSEALKMKSLGEMATKLGYLYMIFFAGLGIIWLIFYPLVYALFTRKNAFTLYGQIFPAMVVAFASSSSAVTLPETMRCMETKVKLPKRVLQTVLPLGMTIHMNGPALYYPMVAIFVAQVKAVPVGFFSIIVISLFAVMMSMGFAPASIGGAMLINHLAFASVLGVENAQDVLAYIVAMEWIMERLRTVTNIVGDSIAAACIDRIVNHSKRK